MNFLVLHFLFIYLLHDAQDRGFIAAFAGQGSGQVFICVGADARPGHRPVARGARLICHAFDASRRGQGPASAARPGPVPGPGDAGFGVG